MTVEKKTYIEQNFIEMTLENECLKNFERNKRNKATNLAVKMQPE
jgi:hypothetical protein